MPHYEVPSTAISRANKEAMANCICSAAIATPTANALHAFPFSFWQVSISSRTGNHHPHIRGIPNETS